MALCHLLYVFCLPIVVYGLEVVPLSKSNLHTHTHTHTTSINATVCQHVRHSLTDSSDRLTRSTSTQDIQQQQAANRSPGSEHARGKDVGTQTKTTITCRWKLEATVDFVGMTSGGHRRRKVSKSVWDPFPPSLPLPPFPSHSSLPFPSLPSLPLPPPLEVGTPHCG